MKRATLLAVTLVVAVILALGWWVTRRDTRADSIVDATPVHHRDGEPAALAEAESVRERTTRASAPTASAGEASSEPAVACRVLVVNARSNTHVPDAEVRWTDTLPVFEDREHPLVRVDPEIFFEAASPGLRTDARGTATLPPSAKPVFVWARIDDRFGSTRVPRQRNEQEISVTIDHGVHLEIQVVDTAERPVSGVPVSIRTDEKSGFNPPLWTGITGSGGFARVRHLQRALAGQQKPFTLVAGFEFPTRTASKVPIDVACVPKSPLRLVLPVCGSVEVRTRDAAGAPLLPENVELNVCKPEMESFVFAVSPHTECKPAEVLPGRAFFPFVETGLELTARLNVDSRPYKHSGRGPIAAGERVTFDVNVGMQRPQLAGRLVDQDRVPLAEAECHSMLAGGNVATGTAVQTDALGRFTLLVPCDAEQRFDGTLAFQRIKGRPWDDSGLVELDRVLHSGVNDVGDVTVRSPLVVATVRLVDEVERVVKGASIIIEVERLRDGVPTWVHSWDVQPSLPRNDTFEIKSVERAKRMRIRVLAGDYMQLEPCVIEPDQPNVRIVMVRSSEVCGRILVDDDVDAKLVEIRVRGLDDTAGASAVSAESTRAQSDGTFRFPRVRARVVDVLVAAPGWEEPLVVLRDLDLRAGGRARDPRLNEIDLRGRKLGTNR